MSTQTLRPGTSGLTAGALPRWTAPAVIVGSLAVGYAVADLLLAPPSLVAVLAVGFAVYLVVMEVATRVVEGARQAADRRARHLVTGAFGLALLPLGSLLWEVVSQGTARLDLQFFTYSMRNVVGEGGGAAHAIAGTLWVTGLAMLISVPIGLLTAIYLAEYASGNRLSKAITFFVDVMTGVPSIVAGLFAYSLMAMIFGPGSVFGFAGSVALSVLMIPVVVRSCEELLRLVPNELREAAYALGVPKWKTILRVVLPTALPGIVTGIMLAIARAAGETAPVLLVAGGGAAINFNPFENNQSSLALFVYQQAGEASKYSPARAWTAALTLVALVLVLTVAAKLLSRRNRLGR